MRQPALKVITMSFTCILLGMRVAAHDISFCGEPVPVNNDFVAQKLMDVITRQMPYVNIAGLRQRALKYFPFIEAYLKKNGIPEDFKYIPIVESGFANLSSDAGANGFWQLMPADARDFDLRVTSETDEREDPVKATRAACQLILRNYKNIKSTIGYPSWILTAAAYNFGVGNIIKTTRQQGADYFTMRLNAETAEYVYKIIAVKELFENPELYMRGFGANVFSALPAAAPSKGAAPAAKEDAAFSSLNLKVSKSPAKAAPKAPRTGYVTAHLAARNKKFRDGDLVAIALDRDLQLHGSFTRKGNVIKGAGWLIDNRIYIDLGYGLEVQVLDANAHKGISVADMAEGGAYLLLKTEIYDD